MVALCRRCAFAPARAKGLCAACAEHKRRTGADRPARVILAHIARVLDAEQEARVDRLRAVVAWEAEAPG